MFFRALTHSEENIVQSRKDTFFYIRLGLIIVSLPYYYPIINLVKRVRAHSTIVQPLIRKI